VGRFLVFRARSFRVRRLDAALRVAVFSFLANDCIHPSLWESKTKALGQSGVEPPHSKAQPPAAPIKRAQNIVDASGARSNRP
jgi:hypothetical protein